MECLLWPHYFRQGYLAGNIAARYSLHSRILVDVEIGRGSWVGRVELYVRRLLTAWVTHRSW